jgi:hypothetical protein
MFEETFKSCDYCDSCKSRLSIVEIYFNFATITHTLCEPCIFDLKHEQREFRIVRRV